MNFLETTFSGNKEFYPTPESILFTMFQKFTKHCKQKGMTWEYKRFCVLEPSAGKGDMLDYYRNKVGDCYCPRADAIELDENLRMILKGNDNCHLIWDNFLTFQTQKHYDLILMNPPFSEGCKHLAKAIELAECNGGDTIIMCLLNAETLRNPFSNERKALSSKLSKLHAEVEFFDGAFSQSERKTDVDTAFVFIDVPKAFQHSFVLEQLEKAEEYSKQEAPQPTEIVTAENYFEQMVAYYNREVKLCSAFMHEYFSMIPFIKTCMAKDFEPSVEYYNNLKQSAGIYNKYSYEDTPVIRLKIGNDEVDSYNDINKAIRIIRRKYWGYLFHNEEFTKLLTSDMTQELYNSVSEMEVYDFNMHNIEIVQKQFIQELLTNLEQTIISLFDELTCEHTYYDGSENIHYYNGWKSNKAHKLNKKVVIPMYNAFAWKHSSDYLDTFRLAHKIGDIEKVFNYLSDGTTEGVSLENVIYWANKEQKNRNLHFKYFDASIFKKGTCHLKFTNEAVVDALNIYVGKHKAWLPPSYGHVAYEDLNDEERAVVDDFQGREEYEKVFQNPSKYLFETSAMLALPENV